MRDELSLLLASLEQELRSQGRWDGAPPAAAALCSSVPFAADTLNFDQWLQWIMLPRMRDLLEHRSPLPTDCAVQPMAEAVYGQQDPACTRIVLILGEIDALLSGPRAAFD